jgi:hypothetical protein
MSISSKAHRLRRNDGFVLSRFNIVVVASEFYFSYGPPCGAASVGLRCGECWTTVRRVLDYGAASVGLRCGDC